MMARHTMIDDRTIEDLVRRAPDRDALDELARLVRPRLERLVRSRMGAAVRAHLEPDDVVQETLLKAFKALPRLEWRGEEAFYRWLGAIAEHVILKATQRAARPFLSLEEEPADPTPSAARAMGREERVVRLERALADLSPDHREVIVLTRIDGLRIAEAAARMGRSPNAVKKLLARALEELRRRFGDTTGSLLLGDQPLELGKESGGPSHDE
jgi:RNA polymerase sigma-70 factor (ECF subfamily)